MNVPQSWKTKTLEEMVDFENGQAHEALVSDIGRYILVNSKFVSTEGREYKKVTASLSPLSVGDVAIVMSDIPKGKALAKCFLIDRNDVYTLNQRIGRLRAKPGLSPQYLRYAINRNAYFLQFDSGVGQTNLRKSEVLECPLLVPPIEEQEKITEILSTWDHAIDKKAKLIDHKIKRKKALMSKYFAEAATLISGGINKNEKWEIKRLSDVIKSHNSGYFINKDNYGDGRNIVGVGDLFNHDAIDGQTFALAPISDEEAKQFVLNEGDLIYGESSLVREGIARTLYVTKQGAGTLFAWHTRRLVIDQEKVLSSFVYYMLNTAFFRNQIMRVATQTALTGITSKDFFNIKIGIPKPEIQKEVVAHLTSLDQELRFEREVLIKLRRQKQGLMQILLTGKVRVKV